MNKKKRQWTISINEAIASSEDGWVFAFTETEEGTLEADCLDHPDNLSEEQFDAVIGEMVNEAAEALLEAMENSEAITMENEGGEIVSTNFWQTELAQQGYMFVSLHEGAIRMLVPPLAAAEYLPEMKTGKSMLIEPSLQHESCLDFVFDDNTGEPFWVAIDTWQIDSPLKPGKNIPFYLYTEERKEMELKAEVRFPKRSPRKKKKK